MSSGEMFYTLYNLTDDKPVTIVVSNRYVCNFKSLQKKLSQITRPDHFLSYFTVLTKDKNACSYMTYANVEVLATDQSKHYDGRLYMRMCNDLEGESRYSFMLFLRGINEDSKWTTSISIPASSIELQ